MTKSNNNSTSSAATTASVAAAGSSNSSTNSSASKYSSGYLKLQVYKRLLDLIKQVDTSFSKVSKRYQADVDYCIAILIEAETDIVYSTENFSKQERAKWLTDAIDKLHWLTIKVRIFYDLGLIHNTGAACIEKLESEITAQLNSWLLSLIPQNSSALAVKRANLSLIKNIKGN